MTSFDSHRRRARLVARVAFVCVCLILASFGGAPGAGSAAAGSPGSAPTAESSPSSPAVAVTGLSGANSARPRLLAAGLMTVAVGLAVAVSWAGPRLAATTRRRRRAALALGDVGDRWRALLIGAPPASFLV